MEPRLSVLLYSKYSSLSKNLMDMIQTSGVDFVNKFALQSLCIDNEKIRKRITQDDKIQVKSVPCLLIMFPDGGLEKYDGAHVFEWVEGIIRQYTPASHQPDHQSEQTRHQQSEEDQWRIQQAKEQKKMHEQKLEKEMKRDELRQENERKYKKQYVEEYEEQEKQPVAPRRRLIKNDQSNYADPIKNKLIGLTSIDDLPSDEDDVYSSDRYRDRKPVARIRSGENSYVEDEELFKVDPSNNIKTSEKGNSRTGNDALAKKSAAIMNKAKEMANSREEAPLPPGHPMNKLQ